MSKCLSTFSSDTRAFISNYTQEEIISDVQMPYM